MATMFGTALRIAATATRSSCSMSMSNSPHAFYASRLYTDVETALRLLLEIRRPVEDHGQRRVGRLLDDGVDEEALAIGGDGVVSRVRRVGRGDLDVE